MPDAVLGTSYAPLVSLIVSTSSLLLVHVNKVMECRRINRSYVKFHGYREMLHSMMSSDMTQRDNRKATRVARCQMRVDTCQSHKLASLTNSTIRSFLGHCPFSIFKQAMSSELESNSAKSALVSMLFRVSCLQRTV